MSDLAVPDLFEMGEAQTRKVLEGIGIDPSMPWLVGRCPKCGGSYALGVKRSDPKGRVLFHTVPQCEKVSDLPPLGFLQWARTEGGPSLQRRGGTGVLR